MFWDISDALGWSNSMFYSSVSEFGFVNKNFTSLPDHYYVTYFFELKDKAENYKNKNESGYSENLHGIFLDFEKPVVDLVSPGINSFTNANNSNFYFDATDDSAVSVTLTPGENAGVAFEPNLTCSLFFEGSDLGSFVEEANFTNGNILGNISSYATSGWYPWYVNCSDDSGRSNVSSIRLLGIDRVDPVIVPSFDTPTEIILNGTDLIFNVTDDFSNVSTVWYNATNSSNEQFANEILATNLTNATVNFTINTSA